MADIRPGHQEDGYVFIGGNPKDQKSWVPAPMASFGKQDEPSFLESAGRGFADVTQGVKQLGLQVGEMTGLVNEGRSKEYTKEVEDEIAQYERGVRGFDVGRLAGNIGGTLPAALVTGGGAPAATILRAGLAGGLAGGAMFVPEDESRAANTILGAGISAGMQAVPAGYQALKNAAKPSATRSSAAAAAESIGVKPTPAQQTGSRTLQRIEAGMENTAGGGLAMEQLGRSNQRAVNAEILKKLGQSGDKLDRAAMGKAASEISQQYSTAIQGRTINPDAQFMNDLSKIVDEFSAPGTKLPAAIREAVDDPRFMKSFTAVEYNRARSLFGKNAVEAYRGGRATEAQAWDALQESVDELAKRNLPSDKAAILDSARERFRILKTVEKATDPVTGDVSPPKLVNAMRQKDPAAFLYGKSKNPLNAAVDASSFLKQAPDSFTASRAGGMMAPTILGGAYGGYEGGYEGMLKGAAIGTALPYALTRGYLGLTAPNSILGNAMQRGAFYAYPAIGAGMAQP